ncbi:MAG TPA: type II secretion system F family protein [Candidatus Poseidoniales archaeon]|jgi:flagellar protein FlaJ|nr:MAG: hypothetical protein CXT69_02440 [Euryarchaeota archaeon]HIG04087.1 type II secretion system F family protein [Candidatus Poseidoniales archaeon]HIK78670.1 type II secretion system F family protein [Candidatus Poseidoniales archaeon]
MARKKKKKIKVDLDLPKNDSTMMKLYAIIATSLILGFSSLGFWIINSDFVLAPNGNPIFVNTYCGYNPAMSPDYESNESCTGPFGALLQDSPQPTVWVPQGSWRGVLARAQDFDMPGLDADTLGSFPASERIQPVQVKFKVVSPNPTPFQIEIRDSTDTLITWTDVDSSTGVQRRHYSNYSGISVSTGFEDKFTIPDLPPGEGYSIALFSDGETIEQFEFTMTAWVYDGIPENMNNKSLWIGPEVMLGSKPLRPMIYLNFFAIGFFILFFPASWYWDKKLAEINALEEKFPDFLRDLAEYWKGGLSMTVAVQTLASSEYGALNPEVKKMSDQIGWGVAFEQVIIQFADRVGTPLVQRAISLINEANKAGGKISDILVTAANDSREIKFLEGERVRTISSYIAVIWVSFFVFLGVIIVLSKVFIPAISGANSGDADDSDASIGNMTIRKIDPLFFLTVFFYGVTMQAMGNGSMAGLMATGRLTSGLKQAGMMIVVCILAFNFVTFTPDLIGVQEPPSLNPALGVYVPSPGNIP